MTTLATFIRWRTSWSGEIRRIECVRETDQYIWYVTDLYNSNRGQPLKKPCREKKTADRQQYHNTWEEAHAYLLKSARDSIERATSRLRTAEAYYEQVWSMKKPAEEAHG